MINKIRSVIMMAVGLLVALGVLPEGSSEFLMQHADAVIGALVVIWGAVVAVQSWWVGRDGEPEDE
jgi:fumarate reductase subunit D